MKLTKLFKRCLLLVVFVVIVAFVFSRLSFQKSTICQNDQKFRIQGKTVYINSPENSQIFHAVISADPNTFDCVSDFPWGWKDNSYLYNTDGRIINGIDPYTFRQIGGPYYKDKSNVFFYTEVVNQADMATFKHVGGWYAKDKAQVFYRDRIVIGADVSTFALLESGGKVSGSYAKDNNNYYYNGNVVNENEVSF